MGSELVADDGQDPDVPDNGQSSPEGSDGQRDGPVFIIDLSYGPPRKRNHWHAGVQFHMNLYCEHYKEEITSNDHKCPAYSPMRKISRRIRPSKRNGYQEREVVKTSCSNCHHSVNRGYSIKRI